MISFIPTVLSSFWLSLEGQYPLLLRKATRIVSFFFHYLHAWDSVFSSYKSKD